MHLLPPSCSIAHHHHHDIQHTPVSSLYFSYQASPPPPFFHVSSTPVHQAPPPTYTYYHRHHGKAAPGSVLVQVLSTHASPALVQLHTLNEMYPRVERDRRQQHQFMAWRQLFVRMQLAHLLLPGVCVYVCVCMLCMFVCMYVCVWAYMCMV